MKSINEQGVRYGVETGGRWALPPALQSKAMEGSFPMDRNSKNSRKLREEAGPCPGHRFLFSKSGDFPNHTCAEKAPWRSRGSHVKGCSLPRPLFGKIHLG